MRRLQDRTRPGRGGLPALPAPPHLRRNALDQLSGSNLVHVPIQLQDQPATDYSIALLPD